MVTRGTITFVFDDGYQAIYDSVVPLLDSVQMPGVFGIPLKETTNAFHLPTTPASAWLELTARGHEIAAHSVHHADLTNLIPEALRLELQKPKEALGATTLIYPGGAHDDQVVDMARTFYQAARSTKWGIETMPPSDPLRLRTINYVRSNWSLWKANGRVVRAWLTNAWLIETYHLVTDEATDYKHTVPLSDFKKHVAFIHRLGIPVKTIRAVVTGVSG